MCSFFISDLKNSSIKIHSFFCCDEDGIKSAYQQDNQMITFSLYKQASVEV